MAERLNESKQTVAKVVSRRCNWYDDFETVTVMYAKMKEIKIKQRENGC